MILLARQPKSKSHLRVLSQLQSEAAPDLAEVTSEAALHRLSVASSVPPVRAHQGGAHSHGQASSSSGSGIGGGYGGTSGAGGTGNSQFGGRSVPLGNRFPEQIDDDMLSGLDAPSPESSEDDMAVAAGAGAGGEDVIELGSDWGGMVTDTEDEDERRAAIWTGIRGSGSGGSGGVSSALGAMNGNGRSPGSDRAVGSRCLPVEEGFKTHSGSRQAVASSAQLPWQQNQQSQAAATRPGKRKRELE